MIARVVFDCMVFIQTLANRNGPAAACYDLIRDGRLELVVSAEILDEVRDVLARPSLQE